MIIFYYILICVGQPDKFKKLLLIQGFGGSSPFKTLPYTLLIIWDLGKPREVDEHVRTNKKNVFACTFNLRFFQKKTVFLRKIRFRAQNHVFGPKSRVFGPKSRVFGPKSVQHRSQNCSNAPKWIILPVSCHTIAATSRNN